MSIDYSKATQNLSDMNDGAKNYIEYVIQKAVDLCTTTSKSFPISASVDVIEELCAKLPQEEATTLERVFDDDTFTFTIGYDCSGKIWFEVEKPNQTNHILANLISECLLANKFQIDRNAETEHTRTYFINLNNKEGK